MAIIVVFIDTCQIISLNMPENKKLFAGDKRDIFSLLIKSDCNTIGTCQLTKKIKKEKERIKK